MKTFDELEQFVTKWQRLKDEYKEAIVQRGFKRLAPSYDVTVSRSCSDKWLGSGRVAVQQVEFMFGLQQAGKEFWGAVVEDSLTVIFPGGFEPPLVAKFGEIIELQDTESKCSITLRAN